MRSFHRCLVTAILALHAALLAWLAARHSPTIHEMAHLPAGICHWQFGMFELYRVNPPLPRMVAALPVLFYHPQTDWGNYQLDPLSRETIPMGIRFAKANGARTLFLFTVARWACIPFCLLGGWVCYRWAGELWGKRAGLLSLCLWCFSPMILGHGAVVMPDVPAAAMGVFAAWRFWKWLREPSWSSAALAGLALGLAELCKTTLLLFFVLWPLAWLMRRVGQGCGATAGPPCPDGRPALAKASLSHPMRGASSRAYMRETCQLITILVLAIYVINVGYAFKGSFRRLDDYRFQSRALTGEPAADPAKVGNRFSNTWLARLPVPLPRDYVQGIDRQRTDFEEGGRSYFHGHWEPRGWWYYYLVGLGIKAPLGTLAALLFVASITVADFVRSRGVARLVRVRVKVKATVGNALRGNPPAEDGLPSPSSQLRDGLGRPSSSVGVELFLLAPGLAILALVSSQTGFSAHVRYAIPALPYLFIWCGKLIAGAHPATRAAIDTNPKRQRGMWLALPRLRFGLVPLCLAATIVESLCVFPHSISYFNLLVGGPRHGHEWLLDSNIAWGQDLIHLKEWVECHPEARPLRLATVGWLDPQALGIEFTIPPVGPSRPVTDDDRAQIGHRSHHAPRDGNQLVPIATDRAGHRAPRDGKHPTVGDDYGIPQTWEEVHSLDDLGPRPGWYAIDVDFLHGTSWSANSPRWRFQRIAEEGLNYEYFRHFQPCDRVGYSYLIYYVTRAEANRVRRELDLPRLAP